MSNRSAQHKHGLHDISGRQPKSKLWKRTNKAKANAKKADAVIEWQALFKEKNVKAPVAKKTAVKEEEKVDRSIKHSIMTGNEL
jgi:hypothetical protein